jgi:hypothetical protein
MSKLTGEVQFDSDGNITAYRKTKQRDGVPWKLVNVRNLPDEVQTFHDAADQAYGVHLTALTDEQAKEDWKEYDAALLAFFHALRDAMPKEPGKRLTFKYQPASLMCYYAPDRPSRAFRGRRKMVEVPEPPKKHAAE